jgi:PAS domain S-box-containing protein
LKYHRVVSGRIRVEAGAEQARLEALVQECGFESAQADAEVLLCAPGLSQPGLPTVLCAAELTPEVASIAYRTGARVWLEAHGVELLRQALSAALEEARSQQVSALVHQSVSDVVFHLRVEGDRLRFVEINPAFTRATGLAESQVIGHFVDEVIPEPSLSLVLSRYRQAIAERRTVRWEEVTPYPTGLKYGEVSVTPMVDARGQCSRLVGTVQDVTEARLHSETVRLYSDMVRSVQMGLTVWNAAADGSIALAAVNPAAERLWSQLPSLLGRPLRELASQESFALIRAVAGDGQVRESGPLHLTGDPRYFTLKVFPLPGERVGLAFEDVTVQTRARSVAAIEQRVLEMVASGSPLPDALEALALGIEEEMPPAMASVLLLSADGARLEFGAAPKLPAAYRQAADGAAARPETGPCGAAVTWKRPVILPDLDANPLSEEQRVLAQKFGLRACWSMPIAAANGRVLGAFALYYSEPRTPTEGDLDVIARSTHVAAIAIQRLELDQQLRELSAHLDAAREEERTRIAREIHDQLGQSLTVLKMDLASISRAVSSAASLGREAVLARMKELSQQCDELIGEVRRISSELRPPLLDHVGLGAALTWKAQELEARTQLVCTVESGIADDEPIDKALSTAVFRVFQEAMTNVVRHAHATRVDVGLQRVEGQLVLEVRDDGRGIRQEEIDSPRSLGLLGIRERARRLGGTASFAACEPGGTRVTLRVPL